MSDNTRSDEPRRTDDLLREANEQLTLKALQFQHEADASEQRWLDQRNLNDELVRKQRLLRVLASELTLTEQRERKRLATELHDYLAQLMVIGRLKVGQARPKALSDATLVMLIDEINDIFSKSLSYTRTLMSELSPPVLQDLGFLAALKWMSEQLSTQLSITVDIQLPPEPVIVSEDQALFLYRAVRELVLNVVKHAQTSQVTIALTLESSDVLHIYITDQGRGFDPVAIDKRTPGEHFGLMSIRERMEAMGGSFQVESAPGRGTTLALGLPLAKTLQSPHARAATTGSRSPDTSAQKIRDVHRVLLADDHALVRQGLRAILEGFQDVSIVGEACNGVEAVSMVDECVPDVIIMDVNMPKMDGIEATKRIKDRHPSTIVIGLSVNNSIPIIDAMKAAGAAAFISKDAAADELHDALTMCHPLAM